MASDFGKGPGVFARRLVFVLVVSALLVAVFVASAWAAPANRYVVTNLVSDTNALRHRTLDSNLVNAWGIAHGPSTPWWVADNGTGMSTVYLADGSAVASRVVAVNNDPTGIVFNPTADFVVSSVTTTGSAKFIFVTEDGGIWGWNANVPGAESSMAVMAVDNSAGHAVYKGVALGSTGGKNVIYATDFHNGHVDVYDGMWNPVSLGSSAFKDKKIPKGYAPFGIQKIGAFVYVTFAKQNKAKHDEVDGQGLGYVDQFSGSGRLIRRVARRGALNGPWGLAMAPHNFGRFSDDLLVGNFGGGTIEAYRLQHGRWTPKGSLRKASNGQKIKISGLWGLGFGDGSAANGPTNTLFFAAGPSHESHGLFGSIVKK